MRTLPADRSVLPTWIALVASAALLLGCTDDGSLPSEPRLDYDASVELAREKFSGWSEPVNAGPGVNSAFQERSPSLSSDKFSLFFTSDRPGGFGAIDIYVSRRDCLTCAFGPALNLGPTINSAVSDGQVMISKDGRKLLFSQLQPDGFEDILVSERDDVEDDLGWGPPRSLCPELNGIAAHHTSPWLMAKRDKSGFNFYFDSRPSFAVPHRIHRATVYAHHDDDDSGDTGATDFGTCDNIEPATELHAPPGTVQDEGNSTIRKDGKEMFFWSGRPNAAGVADARIYTSTRRKAEGPWSAPVIVGPPVDRAGAPEFFPKLSWDARTLVFGAGRNRGGFGVNDIWITERTLLDDDDDDDEDDDTEDDDEGRRSRRR
jgi:hypothetical protein